MIPAVPSATSGAVGPQIDLASLAEAVQEVLPPALVGATHHAQEVVPDVVIHVEEGEAEQANQRILIFAAALGTTAAGAVSQALIHRLGFRWERSVLGSLPNWLRPKVAPTAKPVVVTLTDFANGRSRYVRHVESGEPVLISRHGTVVAALVPVEAGAYEEAVYPDAARRRRAERLERRRLAPEARALTDDQLAEIETADDSETAARYGVDTVGWELLNPPASGEPEA